MNTGVNTYTEALPLATQHSFEGHGLNPFQFSLTPTYIHSHGVYRLYIHNFCHCTHHYSLFGFCKSQCGCLPKVETAPSSVSIGCSRLQLADAACMRLWR